MRLYGSICPIYNCEVNEYPQRNKEGGLRHEEYYYFDR